MCVQESDKNIIIIYEKYDAHYYIQSALKTQGRAILSVIKRAYSKKLHLRLQAAEGRLEETKVEKVIEFGVRGRGTAQTLVQYLGNDQKRVVAAGLHKDSY